MNLFSIETYDIIVNWEHLACISNINNNNKKEQKMLSKKEFLSHIAIGH